MKVMVFGAAGDVGQRFVKELLLQGHEVTALIRRESQLSLFPASVKVILGDLGDVEDFMDILHQQDFLMSALRPASGQEELLLSLTAKAIALAQKVDKPILITGGAASLKLPGQDYTVLTAPNFLPDSVVPIATACQKQYEFCLNVVDVAWTYLAPSAMLSPGERTGTFRLGQVELITDDDGQSHISMEDFAVAAVAELSNRSYIRECFTAGY